MIVYFSASSRNLTADIDTYKRITQAIYDNDGILARDWLAEAEHRGEKFKKGYIETIFKQIEASILSSEVVIVEATGSSTFGVGYEMAIALQNKKPVLALVRRGEEDDSYILAVHHRLITHATYEQTNLARIIKNFMRDNEVAGKDLRFNFVIDRQIYNHLRWKAYNMGKTKAEIIRDLLNEDMKRTQD